MTITDFLLARIAEDEAEWSRPPVASRLLRECKAKRRIVQRLMCDDAPECGDDDCAIIHEDQRILAAVYSDHPDYQQEWAL